MATELFWAAFTGHISQALERGKYSVDEAIGRGNAVLFKVGDDAVKIVGHVAAKHYTTNHVRVPPDCLRRAMPCLNCLTKAGVNSVPGPLSSRCNSNCSKSASEMT